MMTQRRALLAGISGASIGLAGMAKAAPPKADDGNTTGACLRCGRIHDNNEPLKQTGKP